MSGFEECETGGKFAGAEVGLLEALAGAGAAGSPQDREWVATPWSDLSVPLEGQRGQEVLVIIEAPPLSPTMNPAALTQFLVDFLRVVP